MSDAFISYQRDPSAALAHLLQEKLKNQHQIDAYVDTTRADSNKVQFPQRLMRAIADTPTFICLLADTTLESEWVRKEIQQAYSLGKHCVPVFQEKYKAPTDPDDALEYLLNFDGVRVFDRQGIYIDEAVTKIANLVVRSEKPEEKKQLETEHRRIEQEEKRKRRIKQIAGLAAIIALAIVLVIALLPTGGETPNVGELGEPIAPSDTPTPTAVAQSEPRPIVTFTNPAPTATPTPTPSNTPTPTPPPGFEPVTRNADWTPVEGEFDGVTMVLVPVGCFMMGSEDGASGETPVHEQCFEEPFWIDRTEVTQADFARLGSQKEHENGFIGDDRPVESITWFEARDHCESRGMRLPTEREWEYAARGVDNLMYPWGNEWIQIRAVSSRASDRGTANIGNRLAGVSWVGALDMSGNVWEWVSSLYESYPYNVADGRENLSNLSNNRVLRGGSWNLVNSDFFRGSHRNRFSPSYSYFNVGFRCARDYTG